MPHELIPPIAVAPLRRLEREPTDARRTPTGTLCRFLREQRWADRRLGLMVQRDDIQVDPEADALLDQQYARITAACDLQADSVEGVAAKLDIWFVTRLTDGLDEPEDELDRLVATARADLLRLMSAG